MNNYGKIENINLKCLNKINNDAISIISNEFKSFYNIKNINYDSTNLDSFKILKNIKNITILNKDIKYNDIKYISYVTKDNYSNNEIQFYL